MSALAKITAISGKAVPINGDDVDTDRIIPARFMKCVTFDGLGEFAFYDVRFDSEGNKTNHPLNQERYQGASVLVVGNNFGCGSSREHAPQSLHKYGVRAIIGLSYAEIFFGNSTTLGIPCVSVSPADREAIAAWVADEANIGKELSIDLVKKQVTAGDKTYPLTMPETAREALVSGEWDPIALMLANAPAVTKVADKLAYVSGK